MKRELLWFVLALTAITCALTLSGFYFLAQYERAQTEIIIAREQQKIRNFAEYSTIFRLAYESNLNISAEHIQRTLPEAAQARDDTRHTISHTLQTVLRNNDYLFQVHLISEEGFVLAGAEQTGSTIMPTATNRLVNVSKESFFKNAIALDNSQLLIEPASTTNIINAQNTETVIQTAGIGRWIRLASGERVLLRALIDNSLFFERNVESFRTTASLDVFWVAPTGQFLFGGRRFEQLELLKDPSGGVDTVLPKLWRAMQDSVAGTYRDVDGLYVFGPIADFASNRAARGIKESPRTVVFVSNEALHAGSIIQQPVFAGFVGLLYLVLVLSAFFYWRNLQAKSSLAVSHALAFEQRAALNDAYNNLKAAQNLAHIGINVYNFESKTWYMDELSLRNHDLPLEEGYEADAARVARRLAPEDIEANRAVIDRVLDTGEEGEMLYTINWLDGTTHYIMARVQREIDETGKIFLRSVNMDITDLYQTQQALIKTNEAQRQMFGIISHELRTPASAIQMLVNELPPSSQQRQELTVVAQHLLYVIDDLRTAVNKDSEIIIREEPVNLISLQREVQQQLEGLVANSAMNLCINVEDTAQRDIISDGFRLRAILTNLVRNSIAHSEGSCISVNISTDDIADNPDQCQLKLTVADDGKGLPSDDIERLFMAFQRGDSKSPGTGVGLHLVKTWIEKMGGHIDHSVSDLGGACFTIELTVQLVELGTPAPDNDEDKLLVAAADLLRNKRLMLVEDDHLLRRATARLLERHFDITLEQAEDGEQALELFKQQPADIILTDYFMPKLDGIGLIQSLRADEQDLPIIAISAATIGQEADDLKRGGADVVLPKPLTIDALAQAICTLEQQGRLGPTATSKLTSAG